MSILNEHGPKDLMNAYNTALKDYSTNADIANWDFENSSFNKKFNRVNHLWKTYYIARHYLVCERSMKSSTCCQEYFNHLSNYVCVALNF